MVAEASGVPVGPSGLRSARSDGRTGVGPAGHTGAETDAGILRGPKIKNRGESRRPAYVDLLWSPAHRQGGSVGPGRLSVPPPARTSGHRWATNPASRGGLASLGRPRHLRGVSSIGTDFRNSGFMHRVHS